MRHLPTFLGVVVSFVLLTLAFFVIEWIVRGQMPKIRRPGYYLDVAYWFFTPLISHTASRIAVIVTAIPIVLLLGLTVAAMKNYQGYGPLSHQPIWLQAIELLVCGDFIGYWSHRLFHGKSLWAFHAVHHCSTELDWLSSVRLHPVNEAGTRVLETIPLLILGFNPIGVGSIAAVLTIYAVFIHANLNWDYGPLRCVIASPAFHRWHHSKEPEAIDKNFAGFFAFYDVLFGTFYVPQDRVPCNFGIHDELPESLWSHMVQPFFGLKRIQKD